MNVECVSIYLGIIGFILLAAWAVAVFVLSRRGNPLTDRPQDDDFEHQVRIVELENGIFSVQVWNAWTREWDYPFGRHQFDTLELAKKDKESRVAELKREAGYRFKRVVA